MTDPLREVAAAAMRLLADHPSTTLARIELLRSSVLI